ncbi:hypothetical protein GUJ93_ZPchr0008g13981 [Zizania palustris]|uniref:Uncharacterized protein n=1 Tax=Zizania palustris TaxID=103762 RepID=A0A8J5VHX1_ZIZPA|nr:hypothetical protein GUJ93_ZPchr0008g13981 [Zizania palustris]
MQPRRRDRRRPRDPSPEKAPATASSSSGLRFRPALLARSRLSFCFCCSSSPRFTSRAACPVPGLGRRTGRHPSPCTKAYSSSAPSPPARSSPSTPSFRRTYRAATSATPSSPMCPHGTLKVMTWQSCSVQSLLTYNFWKDITILTPNGSSELQRNGSLVLPRVVLEAFLGVVLLKKKLRDKAIDLIVSECRDKGYDGVVLESLSR